MKKTMITATLLCAALLATPAYAEETELDTAAIETIDAGQPEAAETGSEKSYAAEALTVWEANPLMGYWECIDGGGTDMYVLVSGDFVLFVDEAGTDAFVGTLNGTMVSIDIGEEDATAGAELLPIDEADLENYPFLQSERTLLGDNKLVPFVSYTAVDSSNPLIGGQETTDKAVYVRYGTQQYRFLEDGLLLDSEWEVNGMKLLISEDGALDLDNGTYTGDMYVFSDDAYVATVGFYWGGGANYYYLTDLTAAFDTSMSELSITLTLTNTEDASEVLVLTAPGSESGAADAVTELIREPETDTETAGE